MTALDSAGPIAGYFDSAWPAECGGPRRQKVVPTPGLAPAPGERLASVTRSTSGWAVMFVQRAPGELYLLCGAGLADGELPPVHREGGDSSGWVEQVDPATLETIRRSPDLPSGGWLWCGALAAHANGDLYAVNGRHVYRLDPACAMVGHRELPGDCPHNGHTVMSDGNLVVRNLGFRRGDPAQFVVLDPVLEPLGEPLELPERCMGRFSADRSPRGEYLYSTTPTDVFRIAEPRLLWRVGYRNFVQMMVYADTGELVLEDASWPTGFGGQEDRSELVVVAIETGEELGRAASGSPSLGMFLAPGFGRDFYAASIPGDVTRVLVEGHNG